MKSGYTAYRLVKIFIIGLALICLWRLVFLCFRDVVCIRVEAFDGNKREEDNKVDLLCLKVSQHVSKSVGTSSVRGLFKR